MSSTTRAVLSNSFIASTKAIISEKSFFLCETAMTKFENVLFLIRLLSALHSKVVVVGVIEAFTFGVRGTKTSDMFPTLIFEDVHIYRKFYTDRWCNIWSADDIS